MIYNSVKILQLSFLSTFVISFASCTNTFSSNSRSGTSHVSEIKVGIGGIDSLKAADGSQPVTGMHLAITPAPSCSGGTTIDQFISTKSPIVLNLTILKGCEYNVIAELGSLLNSSLSDVYYSVPAPLNITGEQSKQNTIALRLALNLTAAGKVLGLPEKSGQNPPTPSPPVSNLPALAQGIDVQIVTHNGTVKLGQYFTSEYLLIDFSRLGCPPCVAMAKANQASSEFKLQTTGESKCRAATIVPQGTMSDWSAEIGGESAKETIEFTGGHNGFAALFGTNISATPTVLLVDRQGKIVDQGIGDMPAKFYELCK